MARRSRRTLPDSLWFPQELAERLVSLRKARKLTQQQLAVLMGRTGMNNGTISRLETGRFPSPSLRLVADYLRACRADFSDILDILKRYTAQPTAVEKEGTARVRAVAKNLPPKVATEVVKYDAHVRVDRAEQKNLPEVPAKRVMRARKTAAAALWRRKLHSHVVGVINTKKLHVGGMYPEKELQDAAVELWSGLRKARKQPEEWERMKDETASRLTGASRVPESTAREVLADVVEFFRNAAKSGGLDKLPG